MAYTTEAAVRTATGFSSTTNITSATITAYIADADSVINAKVGARYSIAAIVTAPPQIIETISRHITTALLYFNEYGEESENLDKAFNKKMKWAMDLLDQIQTGKMKLYGTDNVELARSTVDLPSFYPTAASSLATAVDSTEPKITMNEKY